jgi:uncharacterized membrane protein
VIVPLFAVLSIVWATLIVAAPALPVPLAGALYLFGSAICHQIPERSFHVDGAQLPVCARCLGIYLGAVLAFAVARRGTPERGRQVLVAGAIPTMVTVALEWMGLWSPANTVRAAAGVPIGAAVALVVTGAVATVHYGQCARPRPIESTPRTHI